MADKIIRSNNYNPDSKNCHNVMSTIMLIKQHKNHIVNYFFSRLSEKILTKSANGKKKF